jgi:LysW-gamma-L-lysine/LysW-L-ornithine aminotransferase
MTMANLELENASALSEIQQIENQYETGVTIKRDVTIVRGEGAILWDENGNRFIDCVGGQGVSNVGHCNPYVVEAIEKQSRTLITCSGFFYNDRRAELYQKLVEILPIGMNKIFLCNSGAEATEGAIKFARIISGKTDIIATVRGFHGRTMGALSATWEKKYREPFNPLVPGFSHIPYNKIDAVKKAITDQTAAILVEPVQGEGGVHPASIEYLQELRQLCDETGVLLIMDEVQTGFCRTGRWWGADHAGVIGDIMPMAKAIGGGLPMGAIAYHEKFGNLPPSTHGSTFGGNPLVCAVSIATIQYMQDFNLAERAAKLGEHAMNRLKPLIERENSPVREVRGRGLIIGVELKQKVAPYLKALAERGVLALNAGPSVLRLLPPLVIDEADFDFALDQIEAVLFEN